MDSRRELEFVGELGSGGFGAVYLANLHGADRFVRRVAVKVLRPELLVDPQLVARQRDEARLLGLLSHHALVQVIDLVTIQGQPAVVMEYVEGIDTARVATTGRREGWRIPERVALEITAATASALDAAYTTLAPSGAPLRVIHRDIKPANILITAHGGVKVLDFGVARADFNREGVTGSAFYGTAAYMGPEFWLQEGIGPAYDVFALGVTLLELLSGETPERAILDRTRYEAKLATTLGNLPDVTAPTRALLTRMLAFSADARPRAAAVEEEAAALAAGLSGEPLARFARRIVPPLLAERSARMSTRDLPSRSEVHSGIRPSPPAATIPTPAATLPTPAGGPADVLPARPDPVTGDTFPVSALERSPPRRAVALLGTLAGVGTLAVAALWWAVAHTDGEAVPEAMAGPEGEVVDPATTDGAPTDPAATDPAVTTPTTTDPAVADAASPAPASPTTATVRAAPTATTLATGSPSTPGGRTATSSTSPVATAASPSSPTSSSASPSSAPPSSPTSSSPTSSAPTSSSPTSSATTPTSTASPASTPASTAPSPTSSSPTSSSPAAPSPPASSPTRSTSSTTRVRFTSVPMGAEVRIDGSVTCATPCLTSVPSGPHQLELVFPDGPRARAITLGAGEPNSFAYSVPAAAWSVVVANLTP